MTNERVGSFVSDLVEMAKAVEQVPVLQAELNHAEAIVSNHRNRITDLEVSLEASRRYAAGLEQRLHDAEVAVTTAELRFLECDDAKGTLERALRGFVGEAQGVLQAVTPSEPKAATVPTPEPLTVVTDMPLVDGSLVPTVEVNEVPVDPTPSGTSMDKPYGDVHSIAESVENAEVSGGMAEGVSVSSDPSLATTQTDDLSGSAPSTVTNTVDATGDTSPIGPYHGKRYIDVPGFINLRDWLEGGGTLEDYDWRP